MIGKATKHVKNFFNINGFAFMVYESGTILLLGATVYSIVENANFIDSLWWAFVTSTTVGYGDISPMSAIGRLTAMVLMLTGIGMFGALTSTITSFFIISEDQDKTKQNDEIKELNQRISKLLVKIKELEVKVYLNSSQLIYTKAQPYSNRLCFTIFIHDNFIHRYAVINL